jgi:hypothetical protein
VESTVKSSKSPSSVVTLSGKSFSKDLVVRILSYLSPEELKNMSKVNSQFTSLVKETTSKQASSSNGSSTNKLPTTAASLPALSTVIESIPFPPPAAIQTTLPCAVTTVAPNVKFSLPVESKVIVPILPEAMPMIVTVPDVVAFAPKTAPVQSSDGTEKKSEVVQINQVLPGYAPSYAHDYVPPEVNMTTVSTFANTISFNVSRYPNLTDIMDSKTYNQKKQELEKVDCSEKEAPTLPPHTTVHNAWDLQYIPAEYGRDDTGKHSVTVSAAKNIAIVKPEVLASGRLLTHMSPVTDTSQAANCSVTSVTQSGVSSVTPSLKSGDK